MCIAKCVFTYVFLGERKRREQRVEGLIGWLLTEVVVEQEFLINRKFSGNVSL